MIYNNMNCMKVQTIVNNVLELSPFYLQIQTLHVLQYTILQVLAY